MEGAGARRFLNAAAWAALLAVIVAACGGDPDPDAGDVTTTTVTSTVPVPTVVLDEPTVGVGPYPGPLLEPEADPTVEFEPMLQPAALAPPAVVPTFVDVTERSGLSGPHAGGELQAASVMTGGAAVRDVDGDADLDVLLPGMGTPSRLMINQGDGTFVDRAEAAGLAELGPWSAATWADIEGDGDADLFVASAQRAAPRLYVNDGAGRFVDEARPRGLVWPELVGIQSYLQFGATWFDIDHDRDPDLFVPQWNVLSEIGLPTLSRLFRNDGNGGFEDVTAAFGLDLDDVAAFTGVFADVDGDGWEDLALTGDLSTSRLYRNDEGRGFTDITAAVGVGTDENGMGSAVADVDGDGHLDWFVTAVSYPTASGRCPSRDPTSQCSGNRLYRGDGAGRFEDVTDRWGVRHGFWGWGTAAEDFDHDGDRDLVMTAGFRQEIPTGNPFYDPFFTDPMRLWLHPDAGTGDWPEVAEAAGLDDRGEGKALVAFDHDRDGDQDVLVVNTETGPVLYRNDTPVDAGWLTVRPVTAGGMPSDRGVRVRVIDADGRVQSHAISTGGSYAAQLPAEAHFGFGDVAGPVTVEVSWAGANDVERRDDVAPGQVLEVVEPS